MNNFENMTLDEIKTMKSKWYKDAIDTDQITALYAIGRYLGTRLNANYGPKYQYACGHLSVYVDDYGNYMTASYNGKEVCNTHFCRQMFIPGDWTKRLIKLGNFGVNKRTAELTDYQNRERAKLITELSF